MKFVNHHNMAERCSSQIAKIASKSQTLDRVSKHLEHIITFQMFFRNVRAMTAIVSSMFAMIFMLFYEPILTPYLKDHFFVNENILGYLLGIGLIACVFSAPIVGILC